MAPIGRWEWMFEPTRRTFLESLAITATGIPFSDGEIEDIQSRRFAPSIPDGENPYPRHRRMKGGTGHAVHGNLRRLDSAATTKADYEDFAGVTELRFYQHALQWGMGISLKIRKGDTATSISLDVDRAQLLGEWLLEAAHDSMHWRASHPEYWVHKMGEENVADRIEEPWVDESELGSNRQKTPGEIAAYLRGLSDGESRS